MSEAEMLRQIAENEEFRAPMTGVDKLICLGVVIALALFWTFIFKAFVG